MARPKMPRDKVTPEQVGKQLADAQKRAGMSKEDAARQNQRTADKINKRGS